MSKYKKSGTPKHSGHIIKASHQALAALFEKFLYFVETATAEAGIILRAPLREKVKYIVLKHIAERHDAVRRNNRGGIRDRLCEAVRASFKLNFNCAVALCR